MTECILVQSLQVSKNQFHTGLLSPEIEMNSGVVVAR
jgi:hypothetical protein